MLPTAARNLMQRLENGAGRRFAVDGNARKLLGGLDRKTLLRALQNDKVVFEPKTRMLIGTESHLKIDETVRPADKSAIFKDSVEQCMEFCMRYFRTMRAKFGKTDGGFGQDWQVQYNIAKEVEAIADGTKVVKGYTAFRNGGTVPPRAGDVLSFQTPIKEGETARHFHIALVSDVYQKGRQWFVKVYEANVPRQFNHPDIKKHYTEIPLHVRNGKFTLAKIETSRQNYTTDMVAAGWLHPLASKALPGAEKNAGHLR